MHIVPRHGLPARDPRGPRQLHVHSHRRGGALPPHQLARHLLLRLFALECAPGAAHALAACAVLLPRVVVGGVARGGAAAHAALPGGGRLVVVVLLLHGHRLLLQGGGRRLQLRRAGISQVQVCHHLGDDLLRPRGPRGVHL